MIVFLQETLYRGSVISILYSTKLWWGKTLANLANSKQFAKVLPAQIYIKKLWIYNRSLRKNLLGTNVRMSILTYFHLVPDLPDLSGPLRERFRQLQ